MSATPPRPGPRRGPAGPAASRPARAHRPRPLAGLADALAERPRLRTGVIFTALVAALSVLASVIVLSRTHSPATASPLERAFAAATITSTDLGAANLPGPLAGFSGSDALAPALLDPCAQAVFAPGALLAQRSLTSSVVPLPAPTVSPPAPRSPPASSPAQAGRLSPVEFAQLRERITILRPGAGAQALQALTTAGLSCVGGEIDLGGHALTRAQAFIVALPDPRPGLAIVYPLTPVLRGGAPPEPLPSASTSTLTSAAPLSPPGASPSRASSSPRARSRAGLPAPRPLRSPRPPLARPAPTPPGSAFAAVTLLLAGDALVEVEVTTPQASTAARASYLLADAVAGRLLLRLPTLHLPIPAAPPAASPTKSLPPPSPLATIPAGSPRPGVPAPSPRRS